MRIGAKIDLSGIDAALRKVESIKYPLGRSMCVAGGSAIRDEAKLRAPVGESAATLGGGGSKSPGSLRDAIYLAFKDSASSETTIRYSVSWNAKKAPHGHLLEFGHWQPYYVVFTKQGWRTRARGKGKKATGVLRKGGPKWIPASPFLRPAYDTVFPRLQQIMIDRGRARFSELMVQQLIPDASV